MWKCPDLLFFNPIISFVFLLDFSYNVLYLFLSASCYANAVLQCLVFTPPLTAYFLQGLHSKACMFLIMQPHTSLFINIDSLYSISVLLCGIKFLPFLF